MCRPFALEPRAPSYPPRGGAPALGPRETLAKKGICPSVPESWRTGRRPSVLERRASSLLSEKGARRPSALGKGARSLCPGDPGARPSVPERRTMCPHPRRGARHPSFLNIGTPFLHLGEPYPSVPKSAAPSLRPRETPSSRVLRPPSVPEARTPTLCQRGGSIPPSYRPTRLPSVLESRAPSLRPRERGSVPPS